MAQELPDEPEAAGELPPDVRRQGRAPSEVASGRVRKPGPFGLPQEVIAVPAGRPYIIPVVHPVLPSPCAPYAEIMPRWRIAAIARKDGFRACTEVQVSDRRELGGRVHEAPLGGDHGRLGAVVGAELGEDGADVELDGALGDKEALGDGGVLEAPGEEREDF